MHQAGPGAGDGHEARPGEVPAGAQQPGSGGDHRGCLDPRGERAEGPEGWINCWEDVRLVIIKLMEYFVTVA